MSQISSDALRIEKPEGSKQSQSSTTILNKSARAALAKETINKTLPNILSSNERARRGVENARLLHGAKDLPKLIFASEATVSTAEHLRLKISLVQNDTLVAAQSLHNDHPQSKIAVLNMASPLQPGGGVLRGAKAQEESLCMRSTLYPSLRSGWYRLPDDAVVYTPDVLVFKGSSQEQHLLEANERFYVDVISCAAVRMPDLDEVQGKHGEKQLAYADPKDEELMSLKIKYIMRTAVKMGVQILVLGALGCGAYRNPIHLVAQMMKRILRGRPNGRGPDEDWASAGIEQVVIAIFDEAAGQPVWNGFLKVGWEE